MSQDADNPDRAGRSELPYAGAPRMDGEPGALPGQSAEGSATGALMPMPEPAPSGAGAIIDAPSIALECLPGILDSIATTLKGLDERVGRLETQLQLRNPTRRLAGPFGASWPLIPGQVWFLVLALATAATVLFLRLFQLDQLQAEIYGDIAIVYEYIADIRAGNWPTYFSLSSGPLYHYLIMPIIALTGPSYFGMKLASVVVSLGVLAATWVLARRLIDDRFALLAVFIAGVSSWLLIFSRLGNSQILVPLLTTCALWLALRFAQHGRSADIVACAAVAALGLYAYPQSFVLAPVIGLTLVCLRWTGLQVRWADLWRFALATILCALPFALIVAHDPVNFFSGYIGGKLESSGNLAGTLFGNVTRALLAMHVRGDAGFRSNPAQLPHLDWISGALFLGGVVFWLQPERRRWSPALLAPLVLLQAPSMLVLKEAGDIPSASRTLGVAPIVYILVASGLWWLLRSIRAPLPRWLRPVVGGALLGAILLLNAQRYFQTYIGGLPYQNTPMGRIMATYLDSLPPDTQIYMVGCCWEYSMPEPKSIQYTMARPDHLHLVEQDSLSCALLQSMPQPAVLIWSFHTALPAPQLESCRAWLPAQMYSSVQGRPVFHAAPLLRDLVPGAAPPLDQSLAGGQLVSSPAQLDGQTVEVLHSPLDIGSAGDLFDNNADTLIRGRDANPLVLELRFAQPRGMTALGFNLATMPRFRIKVGLTREDGGAVSFAQDYHDLPADPQVELWFPGGPQRVRILRIEIYDLQPSSDDRPHIHVRDLQVR
jgi:4-amino-4-deoxy-L-arabinose transferase-like glycosyltransferase